MQHYSLYDFIQNLDFYRKTSSFSFKMAADKGDTNSMFIYALMYHEGIGVSINLHESANYFKMNLLFSKSLLKVNKDPKS